MPSISQQVPLDGYIALVIPSKNKVINILKCKSGFSYANVGGMEILFAETPEALDALIAQKGYQKP